MKFQHGVIFKQKRVSLFVIAISILLCLAVIVTIPSESPAANNADYEITDIDTLKEELAEPNLSAQEQDSILSDANPAVRSELIIDKFEDAIDAVNEIEPVLELGGDGNYHYSERIDIGDGCYADISFEEGKDKNILQKIAESL